MPFAPQTEEPGINSEHITQLISCLRENIRTPDRKQLTNRLLKLRTSLHNDAVPLCSLQAALFNFQDAVCDRLYAAIVPVGIPSTVSVLGRNINVILLTMQSCLIQVKKVLRQQQVKPHWMFALDNLLRQAVQDAITVLLPGIFHSPTTEQK